ncbi:unnamed protein product [Lactuca virosa]|uniref:DhaK domain-containing protein n=1 Tax=Lactuca virosa TaxID=75947 RepID=A0AAU9N637_9ASTR|nr:unnamed protein product [Lactuca virosa]
MKDSWGPLKSRAVVSVIHGVDDVILYLYLGYGIAGATWATTVSQVVVGFMMIEALKDKGYNGYVIAVPSPTELFQIFKLIAAVFIMMMSKVEFCSLLVYFATSMGTQTVVEHQVLVQVYCMFAVGAEHLSQTAQSFMPKLIYGAKRSLSKERMMLKLLVIIGASCGLILGATGTIVPWLFSQIFSPDPHVIKEASDDNTAAQGPFQGADNTTAQGPFLVTGGTPLMELMIDAGKAVPILQLEHGVAVVRVYTGSFMTSLDMAGFSISIMKAEQTILQRLDVATKALHWPVGVDGW